MSVRSFYHQKTIIMTAAEMVLAYWGYGTDYNPNDLSQEQQNELRNTVLLMHTWEEHKMKKVKADAAAYEIQIQALQAKEAKAINRIVEAHEECDEKDKEIEKLKREVIGMDGEIQLLRSWLRDAIEVHASVARDDASSNDAGNQKN
jgi:hypothetical protein